MKRPQLWLEEPLQKQMLQKIEELGRIVGMMLGNDFGIILPRNVYNSMELYMSHGASLAGGNNYMIMYTPSGACRFHTSNDVDLLPKYIRSPADVLSPADMVSQMDYYKVKDLDFIRENVRLTKELAAAKERIEALEKK